MIATSLNRGRCLKANPNIIITDDTGDKKIPIRALVSEGTVTQLDKQSKVKQTKFQIGDWNDDMLLHFQDPTNVALANIKNILVGQIKP